LARKHVSAQVLAARLFQAAWRRRVATAQYKSAKHGGL
jgi:hypothetical protein